ncbi:MAG: carboxypeptidase regulatory-like domain-containing protein [Thermoplasmatales archaeon]|nr:carboxypeptidase regulatory-like domain-containing protein [Thermoplasmatales archaeon]
MEKILTIIVISMFLLVSLSVFPAIGIKVEEIDPQPRHGLMFEFYGIDTYASHQYSDENYGSSEFIRIANEYGVDGSPGWANVAYISFFDLIELCNPGHTNIASAELNFYYQDYENTNPEGRDLNIYRVTDHWSEGTLTWNNQPSYEPDITSAKVPSSTGEWITWDVTTDVKSYVNEWPPDYHQGYRISDDSYWGESDIPTTMVRSRENEENFRPYLLVIVRVSGSQQTSQQSTTGSSSQNVMNIVPSSRTIINNGTLLGYVNDTSMNPIEGALVRVYFHESYEEDYSDEDGYYHVTNIPICYCLKNATCSKDCYTSEWVLLSIVEDTTYDFVLNTTNHPPNAPDIDGPTNYGKVGVEYDFEFSSTDPDGDDIAEYIVNWGDGTPDELITGPFASGEAAIGKHTWTRCGDYIISARAKDVCGFIGPEGVIDIPMTQNRQIFNPIFLQFLKRFPNMFPILRQLLKP